jgi:hypothetical protein
MSDSDLFRILVLDLIVFRSCRASFPLLNISMSVFRPSVYPQAPLMEFQSYKSNITNPFWQSEHLWIIKPLLHYVQNTNQADIVSQLMDPFPISFSLSVFG